MVYNLRSEKCCLIKWKYIILSMIHVMNHDLISVNKVYNTDIISDLIR